MTTDEGRTKYIERRLLEARSKEHLDGLCLTHTSTFPAFCIAVS